MFFLDEDCDRCFLLWNKFCIESIFTNIKCLFELAISSFVFEGLPKSGLAFTNAFKSHAKRWNFEILIQWKISS